MYLYTHTQKNPNKKPTASPYNAASSILSLQFLLICTDFRLAQVPLVKIGLLE